MICSPPAETFFFPAQPGSITDVRSSRFMGRRIILEGLVGVQSRSSPRDFDLIHTDSWKKIILGSERPLQLR